MLFLLLLGVARGNGLFLIKIWKDALMKAVPIAIIISGALIAGTVLYSNGAFNRFFEEPFALHVREKMTDSESTTFRNVTSETIPRYSGDITYCGELNSKNRAGGYVGWTPFIVFYSRAMKMAGNDPWVIGIGEVEMKILKRDRHYVERWCR